MKKGAKIIIGCSAVALVAVIGIGIAFFLNRGEAYRVVSVLSVDGTAQVERETVGALDVYEGMTLQNGDSVSVEGNSSMIMQMDEDKFAYVEQNTLFSLVAEGSARNSKTRFELERGAITSDVQNKLSSDSSYELSTPNSVMAIRGTVVRVSSLTRDEWITMFPELESVLGEYEEYDTITRLSTFEGTMAVRLRYPDGTEDSEEKLISSGKEIWVGGNGTDSRYLGDITDIDIDTLGDEAIAALLAILGDNPELCFTESELKNMQEKLQTEGSYPVYFFVDGVLFGTQFVEEGGCPEEPSLLPTPEGYWDVDFNKTVEETVYVHWISTSN